MSWPSRQVPLPFFFSSLFLSLSLSPYLHGRERGLGGPLCCRLLGLGRCRDGARSRRRRADREAAAMLLRRQRERKRRRSLLLRSCCCCCGHGSARRSERAAAGDAAAGGHDDGVLHLGEEDSLVGEETEPMQANNDGKENEECVTLSTKKKERKTLHRNAPLLPRGGRGPDRLPPGAEGNLRRQGRAERQ